MNWQPLLHRIGNLALARYTLIAGAGWLLDFGLFALLVQAGVPAGIGNIVSAGAGVTWSYFLSTRHVFAYRGRFVYAKFAVYAGYQVAAVLLASAVVAALHGVWPGTWGALAAKIVVTPFTYYANFLFMGLLLNHKVMWK